jgi:YD repeat-containing protein
LAELTQAQDLVGQLAGIQLNYMHAVGIAGLKNVGSSTVGPYVDLPGNIIATTQLVNRPTGIPSGQRPPSEAAAFFAVSNMSSVLESGILEQSLAATDTAVSTVKIIDNASIADKIYDINNSQVVGDTASYWTSTIQPTFLAKPGWQAAPATPNSDLVNINKLVTTSGMRVVAALGGSQAVNSWTGTGYFSIAATGLSEGSLISGGLSGGYYTTPTSLDFLGQTLPKTNYPSPNYNGFSQTGLNYAPRATSYSPDPVSLATGAFVNDHDDIEVGSGGFPYSLGFSRHYDSNTRFSTGALGRGWTHAYAITAKPDSDGFQGMGADSPISGASAIAAIQVMQDIFNQGAVNGIVTPVPVDRLVIGAQISRWLMDALTNNVVTVTQGQSVEQFVTLADATYKEPLGSTATLALTGGVYVYTTQGKTVLTFNTAGNLVTWRHPAGPTVTLTYNGANQLSSVANTMGRRLNFTFLGANLYTVDDGVRSVY